MAGTHHQNSNRTRNCRNQAPDFESLISEEQRGHLLRMLHDFAANPLTHMTLPSELMGIERRFLHEEADRLGLSSQSFGEGARRRLSIYKTAGSNVQQATLSEERSCTRSRTKQSKKHAFYSALVLDSNSQRQLQEEVRHIFPGGIPPSWTLHCEHMTICMGSLQNPKSEDQRSIATSVQASIRGLAEGQEFELRVVSSGKAKGIYALGVIGCVSLNRNPHVTVACAPHVRPTTSNLIEHWEVLSVERQLVLRGTVRQRGSSRFFGQVHTEQIQRMPNIKRPKVLHERRAELDTLVANFVASEQTKITCPESLLGLERKYLHEEAERYGCTSQTFGRGDKKVLCLFKGTRFREERLSSSSVGNFTEQTETVPESSDATRDGSESGEEQCQTQSMDAPIQLSSMVDTCSEHEDKEAKSTGCSFGEHAFETDAKQPAQGIDMSAWQDPCAPIVRIIIGETFDYLHLIAVMRAAQACRCWKELASPIRVVLSPSQIDLVLQFCLLEVLHDVNETRLPLALSAVYGDMCTAARKASNSTEHSLRLQSFLPKATSMEPPRRPYHMPWAQACSDLRRSSYKTLGKMGKHFQGQRLIETCNQRFHVRMNNTRNFRTCKEMLLMRINREHLILQEHRAWRLSLETCCR